MTDGHGVVVGNADAIKVFFPGPGKNLLQRELAARR